MSGCLGVAAQSVASGERGRTVCHPAPATWACPSRSSSPTVASARSGSSSSRRSDKPWPRDSYGSTTHRPPHSPAPPANPGRGRSAGKGWRGHPSRSGRAATAYAGVGFSGLGLLTNHPFDLAYQAAEAFTAALQEAHQGGRVHEDAAPAADLFKLRLRPVHRREDAAPRSCSRKRSRQSCWKRRLAR